eukprot:340904_1
MMASEIQTVDEPLKMSIQSSEQNKTEMPDSFTKQSETKHFKIVQHNIYTTKLKKPQYTHHIPNNSSTQTDNTAKRCYICFAKCEDVCCRNDCTNYCCYDHMCIAAESHFIACCQYNEEDIFCDECGKQYRQLSLTCACIFIVMLLVIIIVAIKIS